MSRKLLFIEMDVLSLIIGYSFGGLTGLGIAASIMLAWSVVGFLIS